MGRLHLIRPESVLLLMVILAGSAAFGLQAVPPAAAQSSAGAIAYVRPNNETGDEIRLINADGSNDRRIWTVGTADAHDVEAITGLDWRPDGGEIAFASNHEAACSWYDSDIYAVRPDGGGYRRVTNAPHCAGLASYPKGSVTVTVQNYNFDTTLYLIYVAGAPGLKSLSVPAGSSSSLTFTDVADFGSEVVQPVVAINGLYRWIGGAVADVQPGQTVDAGMLTISGSGMEELGAYKPSWRHDGLQVGYTSGCGSINGIAATPPAGDIGQPLLGSVDESACVWDWGPTAATANQLLYGTYSSYENDTGIFRASEGGNNRGELLVPLSSYSAESVNDIEWLPDGSGFLFVKGYVDLGILTDIFRYDFASDRITQLTHFEDEELVGDLSISPDGQSIVFERAATRDDPADLWVMRRDGSDMRLLARNAANPAWSPQALPAELSHRVYLPLVQR